MTTLGKGAINDDFEQIIKKHWGKLKGTYWTALAKALAVGDSYKSELARQIFDQLFLSSASGIYLDRKASNYGIVRPENLGLSDDVFRKLAITINSTKTTQQILLETLEIFYGSDATRAYSISGASEPYDLSDGSELKVKIDNLTDFTITFNSEDFSDISAATAIEVANVITRAFRIVNNYSYAVSYTDPETDETYVKIYSGSLGLSGSVAIWGGKAQNTLQFPEEIETTQANTTQWNIIEVTGDKLRFTWVGGTDPNVGLVNIGNYVNIYGSVFNAYNRGSFEIIDTTNTSFDIKNANGIAEVVTQTSAADIKFFKPTKRTIHNNLSLATVVDSGDTLDIYLPATSEIVERSINTGAYLHASNELDISSAERDEDGIVTIETSTAHGLSVGQYVLIDGLYPDGTTTGTEQFSAIAGMPGFPQAAMTLMADGRVMNMGGGFAYIYEDALWQNTTAPIEARAGHTLELLKSGKILAIGGDVSGDTCELYDPDTETWTETGLLAHTRLYHNSVRLDDDPGRIWVNGGANVTTTEVYNPTTGLWSSLASSSLARISGSTASKLANGLIVVIGGNVGGSPNAITEVYNQFNNTWKTSGSLSTARYNHTATIVNLGTSQRIYVIGGTTTGTNSLATVEIYNPATGTFSAGASMAQVRRSHTATLLHNGHILVTGGLNSSGTELTTSEIYDPYTNTWRAGPTFNSGGKSEHNGILITNNRVVLSSSVGGPEDYVPVGVINAGGLNGYFKVLSTPSSTEFTYSTPEFSEISTILVDGATVMSCFAITNDVQGPFIYDPDNGIAITGVSTTLNQNIVEGTSYPTLTVTSTANFPNEAGYLVFAFGTENVTTVRYLGKISTTKLLLDPSYQFKLDFAIGTDITLLEQIGGWEPETPEDVGSLYLTASNEGRIVASNTIDQIVAGGINVNKIVNYPGDEGLGGEGLDVDNSKKPDKVEVWGNDDYDQ